MKKALFFLFLLAITTVAKAQIANQPNDLYLCDVSNNGMALFDLTLTEAQIIDTQDPSDFTINYYLTQVDADNSVSPIANPMAFFNSSNPQTIFARLEALSNGNFDTTNFDLIVLAAPSATTPTPLQVCDDDGDGFAFFDLTLKDAEISNGDPDLFVLYYETLVGADAGDPSGALASPYSNVVAFAQILYARAENEQSGCYAIVELELRVLDGCPIIATDPTDLFINEGDDDGSAIFDLTVNEPQMLGSQDPNLYRFSYHETFEDSEGYVNEIQSKTAYQNIANPQTIYVRLTNNANGSYALTTFVIETDGVLNITENNLNNLQLYPNPVLENLSIRSQFLTSESSVVIYNLQGQQVFSEKRSPENGTINIDVSGISEGIYLLKLTSEGNAITRKLVKN
jgi:hypothetical protein